MMHEVWTTLLLGGTSPATLALVRELVVMLIALVLSIAVHEFGHAIVADKLGDLTPRSQGRVTLNPAAHADPIGTITIPLLAMGLPLLGFGQGFLIGWGRPVQINPAAFTRRLRTKTSHMLVAAAGPAMNVLLALFVGALWATLLATGVLDSTSEIADGLVRVIHLNWVLMFFNLIPCPPLDGGAVLAGLLPDRHHHVVDFLNQYGLMILIGLVVSGVLAYVVGIPANTMTTLTLRLFIAIVT